MIIDITPLSNAITRFEEGWETYQRDTTETLIRDGLIQRFELLYEIAHKTLKRYLESTSASPQLFDLTSFQDLIRSGNEAGLLLGDWSAWKIYRDMRAKTSHTYDEKIAIEVVEGIPPFLEEVKHLRDELKQRVD